MGPRLLIKRDDETGLAGGGNKTRRLEFTVAEAIHRGEFGKRETIVFWHTGGSAALFAYAGELLAGANARA